MTIRRISIVILAIAVSASLYAVASADSVQWGENENRSTSRRDLRWSQPKAASKVVSAQHVASSDSESVSNILQVQHTPPPIAPPAPPSMTPAQRDTIFPERRPQSNTPPTGATLKPSTPSRTSNFSSGSTTVEKKPAPQSTSSTTTSKTTPKNDTVSNELPKSESRAVELKNPALQETESLRPSVSGTRAPQPLDPYSSDRISARNREIECPGNAGMKSIRDISYDIRPMPGTQQPKECPLITTSYNGRHFAQTCFQWKASALCTKGAYFEDVQLERYGHSICPVLEPVISGAKFFITVPFLPYKMGLQTPDECVYTLGHYRAGNCAPYMLDPLPISVRAILFEGAAIGGAVALIP